MDLLMLVLAVVFIGFVIWALTTWIPLPPYWATTIQVIALLVVLWVVFTRFVHLPNVLR